MFSPYDNDSSRHIPCFVIGVYEEYQTLAMNSWKADWGSMLFYKDGLPGPPMQYFSLKFDVPPDKSKLSQIESLYQEAFPNSAFEHSFFDENIISRYKAEQLIQAVLTLFTGLAVVISCLGLFALISISLAQRTKEIGIRKVLGASFMDIFGGVSRSYLSIVLIASAIGLPLVWYFANDWLDGFTERIQISWSMMLFPIMVLTGLILGILITQIFRAANTNPVESLRNE